MPKVSVIVPIYNIEPFLQQCLQSIADQSFEDFECIMVDDGSTDESPAICDEFAAKDTRFIAVHQPNGGTCVARNTGIDKARTDLITFVDHDDYLMSDHLETLMDLWAPGVMPLCNATLDEDGARTKPLVELHNTGCRPAADFAQLYVTQLLNMPWNKLFERERLNATKIRFIPGQGLGEDIFFVIAYLRACPITFNVSARQTYLHRLHGNAHKWRFNDSFFEAEQQIQDKVLDCAKALGCPAQDFLKLYQFHMETLQVGIRDVFHAARAQRAGNPYKNLKKALENTVVQQALADCLRSGITVPGGWAIHRVKPRLYWPLVHLQEAMGGLRKRLGVGENPGK